MAKRRKTARHAFDTPDTVTLRVARVIFLLARGRAMTTQAIAAMTGLSQRGALDLMTRLSSSHHVPVVSETLANNQFLWSILPDQRDEHER